MKTQLATVYELSRQTQLVVFEDGHGQLQKNLREPFVLSRTEMRALAEAVMTPNAVMVQSPHRGGHPPPAPHTGPLIPPPKPQTRSPMRRDG